MLIPTVLILLSSAVNFGTSCCEKKERISTLLDTALDLLSKVKMENISCPEEPKITNCKPMDCSDLYRRGVNKSGAYTVWPVNRLTSMRRLTVYCDMDNGGWTVIQRRGDFGRANDFFHKNWAAYKKGFGDVERDFWLGNDNIFALTNQRLYSVYFALEDEGRNKSYAHYDNFWIEEESNNYTIHISGFRGTAGDSIKRHNGKQFTTMDQNNDKWPYNKSCIITYKSGWWFNTCYDSNLNGMYNSSNKGIFWHSWKSGLAYLPRTEIKIRPFNF